MADSSSSSCKCSKEEPCVVSETTRSELLSINCELNHLLHRISCCTARGRGDQQAPCHDTREDTAERVLLAVADLEQTLKKIGQAVQTHAQLQVCRTKRGRERVTNADSGIGSLICSTGRLSTECTQETVTFPAREPTENDSSSS